MGVQDEGVLRDFPESHSPALREWMPWPDGEHELIPVKHFVIENPVVDRHCFRVIRQAKIKLALDDIRQPRGLQCRSLC